MENLNKITTPVCAACGTRMRCKKNDFILGHTDAYSEVRWNGDLYNCPQCQVEIIVGFGKGYKVDSSYPQDLRLKCNVESSTKLP